jgi:ubiquinone/menaquinone biosynthesis C-methylase UbiE
MGSTPENMQHLKEKMRATWMAGDFGKIALFSAPGARDFVAELHLKRGMKVLDIACGTGNLAIPAAQAGADLTGVDIAPNLLEQARARAATEGVTARFVEGDAEQLPFADASFDVVMSMFGAMFAPRPELVAAEMIRVCRPGGTMAMANWTREGFVGKTFAVNGRHVPPPAGLPSPLSWGDEATVNRLLQAGTKKVDCVRRTITMEYPFAPRQVLAYFRKYFGPTQTTYARLDEAGQKVLTEELEKLWQEHNEADGEGTRVTSEYLAVIAQRA